MAGAALALVVVGVLTYLVVLPALGLGSGEEITVAITTSGGAEQVAGSNYYQTICPLERTAVFSNEDGTTIAREPLIATPDRNTEPGEHRCIYEATLDLPTAKFYSLDVENTYGVTWEPYEFSHAELEAADWRLDLSIDR